MLHIGAASCQGMAQIRRSQHDSLPGVENRQRQRDARLYLCVRTAGS